MKNLYSVSFKENRLIWLCPPESAPRPREAADAQEIKEISDISKKFVNYLSDNPARGKAFVNMDTNRQKTVLEAWIKTPSESDVQKRSSFDLATNVNSEKYYLNGKEIDPKEHAIKMHNHLLNNDAKNLKAYMADIKERAVKPREITSAPEEVKEWFERWQLNLAKDVYDKGGSIMRSFIQKFAIGSANIDLSAQQPSESDKAKNAEKIKTAANNYLNPLGFYASVENRGAISSRIYCYDTDKLPKNRSASQIVKGLENSIKNALA